MDRAGSDSASGRGRDLGHAQIRGANIENEIRVPPVVSREVSESERRAALDDTDFIAEWANATQPAFLPLHGTIEGLRKRDGAKAFRKPPHAQRKA